MKTLNVKVVGFLLVIGIGALALTLPQYWNSKPSTDGMDVILVQLTFEPPERNAKETVVGLTVTVNGNDMIKGQPIHASPWDREIPVPKGSSVSVLAIQSFGHQLECRLHRNGLWVAADKRYNAGAVRCLSGVK